jgi:hypothetical protein
MIVEVAAVTTSYMRPRLREQLYKWRNVSCVTDFTTLSTRIKEAASNLGFRDINTIDTLLIEILKVLKNQNLRAKYSSQTESSVGKRLLKEIEEGTSPDVGRWNISHLQRYSGNVVLTDAILAPDPQFHLAEDQVVNAPLHRAIAHNSSMVDQLKLTVSRSKLIDSSGREQRADMSLFDGLVHEWPHAVTLLDGKHVIKGPLIGQGMLRARAVLDMQPYRQFVVIPLYTRTSIVFLRVERDYTTILLSEPLPLFTFFDNKCLRFRHVGEGFLILLELLQNPELLGFVPCPKKLESLQDFEIISSTPICARSANKCVFLTNETFVVKTFSSQQDAILEFAVTARLQEIEGVLRMLSDKVLTCSVRTGSDIPENWYAITLEPYCTVLTTSVATPAHFAKYASILAASDNCGINHNDISFDNLLLCEHTCYIGDWGLATTRGTTLPAGAGKILFAPFSCMTDEGEVGERTSSLLQDLESLYMVAICCSLDSVPWSNVNKADMRDSCAKHCGLGYREFESGTRPRNEWAYLITIGTELCKPTDECDVNVILDAFAKYQ